MSTLVLLMQNGSSLVMTSMYFYLALYVLLILSSLIFQQLINNYIAKFCRQRTEEFVVRAYKGGKKKAAHKSTSPIFQRYLYVKENLLSMRFLS
jgi:hypothetical protein